MWLSAVLAVGASLANATSSTLQRKANLQERDVAAFSPRRLLYLLRRPAWLAGIGSVMVGFVLQAAALARGELAFVEPILTLELPFTLAIAGRLFRRRLHRREWAAALMMAAGLGLLVTSLRPYGGYALSTPNSRWLIGSMAVAVAVAVMVGKAVRSGSSVRAALLGVSTGALFGLTAAFMAGMSESLTRGPLLLVEAWQTWAMVATGVVAMYLLQNALSAGTLLVVQPGLTLTDPLVSILWGVLVFTEHVHTGVWLLPEIAGALLIAGGTISLSRSPLIHLPPPVAEAASSARSVS
jgi:drug/metabolite transporter (DMT)-like permease